MRTDSKPGTSKEEAEGLGPDTIEQVRRERVRTTIETIGEEEVEVVLGAGRSAKGRRRAAGLPAWQATPHADHQSGTNDGEGDKAFQTVSCLAEPTSTASSAVSLHSLRSHSIRVGTQTQIGNQPKAGTIISRELSALTLRRRYSSRLMTGAGRNFVAGVSLSAKSTSCEGLRTKGRSLSVIIVYRQGWEIWAQTYELLISP